MISIEQVLEIHSMAIEKFGGSNGLRDAGALESAISRPFQTFGGQELYSTIIEKAAAICESIIINHPFVDGNKRTGYILMESLLLFGQLRIQLSDKKIYPFIVSISTGEKKFDEIVSWLHQHTTPA